MSTKEQAVWSGRTSQWMNFPTFLLWGALGLTVVLLPVSAGVILWRYLVVRNELFELTSERLKMHSGVLNKKISELELYRVTDTQFDQPFWLRLVGLAHVRILSADKTTPLVTITAVPDARELREKVRELVEVRRAAKGVRVSEIE
ncbi:MAG: hypothetical protein RI884_1271 [Pseudomonadota bacterium]|jgi:uncharacterized membrane protein YdbT with pleckstrin-like domain